MGLLGELVALSFLFPDGQEPHPGMGDVQDGLGVDAAHERELHQMFGFAVHVGAHVQDDAASFQGGHDRGDGRPGHPRQSAQVPEGRGHGGAGGAGRDESVGLAFGHHLGAEHDAGIFLGAAGFGGFFVHAHHGGRVHDQEGVLGVVAGQLLLQELAVTHQDDLVAGFFLGLERPLHVDGDAPVAAHGVQGDAAGHDKVPPLRIMVRKGSIPVGGPTFQKCA